MTITELVEHLEELVNNDEASPHDDVKIIMDDGSMSDIDLVTDSRGKDGKCVCIFPE